MTVDRVQKGATYGEPTPTGVSVAVGWVVMVGVALLAAAMFPPAELPPRAVLMAVAAGAYAALVADLRAVAAVTALATATFVGFLAHRFGELTGGGHAWSYAAVIALAAALGTGYRHMRSIGSPGDGNL
ncbi:hypothetical protein GA0070624_4615 [Micromonospora rhizosphaerae]|uniref:Uncharacterized protein n=1 Tax=Micromonospora rhizosphaerae TaxID=568872 RepID=A0A1C6STQ6_9ACTN|nr:hypothetical protein [Micromonospora rhizosphaerae]SCL32976.1 hypothetical protein GA0070624_4615 [Micromonospora rhizosphaerae]